MSLQVLRDLGGALQETIVVRLAPDCRGLVVAKILGRRVTKESHRFDHKVGVEVLTAPKDILEGFAHGLPQVLQLLPKHHALRRADTAVELVVFHAKVLARVEHVIGEPEA